MVEGPPPSDSWVASLELWIPEMMDSDAAEEDGIGRLPSWEDLAGVGEGLMSTFAPSKSVRRVNTLGGAATKEVVVLGEKLEHMAEHIREEETETQKLSAVSVLLVIQTDVFQVHAPKRSRWWCSVLSGHISGRRILVSLLSPPARGFLSQPNPTDSGVL